jgi:hypothetical protein
MVRRKRSRRRTTLPLLIFACSLASSQYSRPKESSVDTATVQAFKHDKEKNNKQNYHHDSHQHKEKKNKQQNHIHVIQVHTFARRGAVLSHLYARAVEDSGGSGGEGGGEAARELAPELGAQREAVLLLGTRKTAARNKNLKQKKKTNKIQIRFLLLDTCNLAATAT